MLLLGALDVAAARVDVADDRTQVVAGRGDLDGHHRLQDGRVRPAGGLLEAHRPCDLERELGGVDVVVGTVEQCHSNVLDGVAGQHAKLHSVLDARIHRRDVLLGDAATGDGVDELVARPRGQRLDLDDDLGVLARSTGLLLVRVLGLLHLAAQRLAVRHLGLADVRLDLELPAHAVDHHLEVKLAHAGDDRLAGLLVGVDAEGRVLFGEPLDRDAQLLLVGLGLGLHGLLDDRVRELHRLQHDRVSRVAERLARARLLEAHDRADHAGTHRVHLFTLVRVHLVDLADPLLLALGRVEDL